MVSSVKNMLIMNAFFDFNTDVSQAAGFGLFSAGHILWLAAGALSTALLCRAYMRTDSRRRRALALGTALTSLGIELLRAALLMAAGKYDVGRLPLHLCGLAVYIELLHALRPRETTGQFLYAFCMPGALFALVFPDWSCYPLWHFTTVSAFLLHILLAAYPLMLALGGDIRPEVRETPRCLGIMLALAAPVYVFDRLTDTNYMFLNWPSPGSPLEWFAFLGRPGYLLGYLPILCAVWALLYLPFALRRGRRGK